MASHSPPPIPPLERAPQPFLLPARKPIKRTRRISLFDREVRLRLSAPAVQLLLDSASVISEGEVADGVYGGSTMLTIDLSAAGIHFSEVCDAVTAHQLERLLATDEEVEMRARAIARTEAETRAKGALDNVHVDMRVRRRGGHFHLDMDIEATLGMAINDKETP